MKVLICKPGIEEVASLHLVVKVNCTVIFALRAWSLELQSLRQQCLTLHALHYRIGYLLISNIILLLHSLWIAIYYALSYCQRCTQLLI